jgi:hypothetical protein
MRTPRGAPSKFNLWFYKQKSGRNPFCSGYLIRPMNEARQDCGAGVSFTCTDHCAIFHLVHLINVGQIESWWS